MCCDGCLFGLFFLAPPLRGVAVGGVFGLVGVLWFCVVCVVGSALCCFLRVEVVVVCVGCLVFLGATERSEGGSCGVVGCWWVFSWFRSSPPSGCRCQTSGRCCSAHTCSMFVEAFVVPRLIDRNGSLWALAFRHGTDPRFRSRCASVAD